MINQSLKNEIKYCCMFRISSKKNNLFINITDLKGKTIVKYSTGFYQNKVTKKNIRKYVKLIIAKASLFVVTNFKLVNVIIKTNRKNASFYLRLIRQKFKTYSTRSQVQWDKHGLISLTVNIPTPHNGCRPPKKRRV